ncbi:unnamed protein product [Lactuca saligna]|uniref:P-type phospholipid transporter n=1 Tax=Lactuca saligna TaxID=75948 RepID=A0AA35YDK9_LACSI|nr:unnamed protein product [Lactuca saligna]
MKRWYLRPDDSEIFFDPKRAPAAAIFHFLTTLLLYTYLIPISLYVSIEIVKVLQTIFINNNIHMYYEEADKPAHTRTSNITEELSQINTILSDKTGTLTCNSMEFIKCSIAGTTYGRGVTEVERAMAKKTGSPLVVNGRVLDDDNDDEDDDSGLFKFFRLLAICHTAIPDVDEETGTAIPDVDEETGRVTYEAESLMKLLLL